jgi:hypothetical protein
MATVDEVALKLKVAEAMPKDLGRGLARLDPADLARLGVEVGEVVEIFGKRTTVAKAMPAYKEHRGQSRIQIDGVARENAGAAIDQSIEIRKAQAQPARRARSPRPSATSNTSAACSTACPSLRATAWSPPFSATARPISRSPAPPLAAPS